MGKETLSCSMSLRTKLRRKKNKMAFNKDALKHLTNSYLNPIISNVYTSAPYYTYASPHWTEPFNIKLQAKFGDRVILKDYPGLIVDKAWMGRVIDTKLEVYQLVPDGREVILDSTTSTFETELFAICDYYLNRANRDIKNELAWEEFKRSALGLSIMRTICGQRDSK